MFGRIFREISEARRSGKVAIQSVEVLRKVFRFIVSPDDPIIRRAVASGLPGETPFSFALFFLVMYSDERLSENDPADVKEFKKFMDLALESKKRGLVDNHMGEFHLDQLLTTARDRFGLNV